MKRPIIVVAAAALAATTIAAMAGGSAAQADSAAAGGHGSGRTTLAGSAVPFAAASNATGAVAGSKSLTIQLWLQPRTAAAESFATAVATPGNASFGHFLSPAAYTARFGATSAEAAGVEAWLRSSGFTGVATDAQRDYVQATAPVSTIDSAFRVQLEYFRPTAQANAGSYQLRANDRPVSLPSSVAASVLGVTGLDNAAPQQTYIKPGSVTAPEHASAPKPATFPCSSYYAQHHAYHLPKELGTTTFSTVLCGYTAGQVRRAYGYNSRNTGKGVSVALVESGLAPDMFLTLQDFAKRDRIQSPSPSRYSELSLGRGDACGDPFDIEEQIDVEMAYVMAPLASELVVGGDSCDDGYFGVQSVVDADIAVLNGVGGHPLADITSNSWDLFDEESAPPELLKIEHSYLVRAAAEGVSMLYSSGDSSGVQTPSVDPYATAVGGTTLGIGLKDPRDFETGWSDDGYLDFGTGWTTGGEAGAAGGGQSLLWAQPAYQRGVVPKSLATPPGNRGGLVRTVPDISALADPYTGVGIGLLNFNNKGVPTSFFEATYGGTSVAAPLVAGMVADAEQGRHPFGFLNPALYRLAGTSAIHDALPITSKTPATDRGVVCDEALCGVELLAAFDDQSESMVGYTGQVTRKGYDTMTGIGTPNGQNFVNALRTVEKKK
jgi:subtilase family serine protease